MKVELTINGQPYSLDNASNNEGLIDRNTETEEISGESILSTEEAGKKTENEETKKQINHLFIHQGDPLYETLSDPSKCSQKENEGGANELNTASDVGIETSESNPSSPDEEKTEMLENEEVEKKGKRFFLHEEDGDEWNNAYKAPQVVFLREGQIPEGATPEDIQRIGYELSIQNITEKVKQNLGNSNKSNTAESQPARNNTEAVSVNTNENIHQRPPVQDNTAQSLPNPLPPEHPAKPSSEMPISIGQTPMIVKSGADDVSLEAEKTDKAMYLDLCDFIRTFRIRWLKGQFWIYAENYYRCIDKHELSKMIGVFSKHKYGYLIKKYQSDLPALLEAEGIDIESPPRSDLIAFRNALLDSHLRPISPHPDLIVLHQINANYVPSLIGKCPTWHAFIDFQTGGNPVLKKRFFQAFALLLCNANAKKFVVFYGIGDSGKSVVMRFLSELFPNDTFPLNLNQFGEKFVLECTSGKKFGICADLPAKPLNKSAVGIIKEITGGDRVNAQAKYGAPHELLTEGGFRAVFASNHPLVLSENDDAFWNRLVYIAFTKAIPKEMQDPNLLETLLLERDAFVNTCMQELPELLSNNFNLVGAEETKEAIAKYQKFANRSVSDIAYDFFENTLVIEADCFTRTEDIRQAFLEDSKVSCDVSTFGKLLRAYLCGFPQVREARLPNSQGKARGYQGIKMANYSSDIII